MNETFHRDVNMHAIHFSKRLRDILRRKDDLDIIAESENRIYCS